MREARDLRAGSRFASRGEREGEAAFFFTVAMSAQELIRVKGRKIERDFVNFR